MEQTRAVSRTHTTDRSRPPLRLTTDTYLTDGTDLFRCVSADRSGSPDGTALLEDCLTLDPIVVPLEELRQGSLRIVRLPHAEPEPVGGTGLEPVTSCL